MTDRRTSSYYVNGIFTLLYTVLVTISHAILRH